MAAQRLKQELIRTGRQLYERFLVTGRAGNLSCRLDKRHILITASGTSLGSLRSGDVIRVGTDGTCAAPDARPSSELPLHIRIHREHLCSHVIHCHPPLTNAYFAVHPVLKELIHETRFCLGDIPVIPQREVNVTDPGPVVKALRTHRLVVLQFHGVVATGDSFADPVYLIETLESAVHMAATARLFKKDLLDGLDRRLAGRLRRVRR